MKMGQMSVSETAHSFNTISGVRIHEAGCGATWVRLLHHDSVLYIYTSTSNIRAIVYVSVCLLRDQSCVTLKTRQMYLVNEVW